MNNAEFNALLETAVQQLRAELNGIRAAIVEFAPETGGIPKIVAESRPDNSVADRLTEVGIDFFSGSDDIRGNIIIARFYGDWGAIACWLEADFPRPQDLLALQQAKRKIDATFDLLLSEDRKKMLVSIEAVKSLLKNSTESHARAAASILKHLLEASEYSVWRGSRVVFSDSQSPFLHPGLEQLKDKGVAIDSTKKAVAACSEIEGEKWVLEVSGCRDLSKMKDYWDVFREISLNICRGIAKMESQNRCQRIDRVLEKAISGSPVVLYELDRYGNCTFRVGGSEIEEIFPERLLGRNIFEENAAFPRVISSFKEAFALGGFDSTIATTDGSTVMRSHTARIEGTGGLAGVAIDVTEQHSARKNMERVLYSLSHDLTEPLRAIANHQQLLARRMDLLGISDPEARSRLDKTIASVRRASRMIDDQLDLARVDSQKKSFASCESEEIVREAIEELKETICSAGASVQIVSFLPQISCDRRQILQVFRNLIINAIKFHERESGEPPTVWIGCRETRSETSNSEMFWQFSVADNGIGIDMQYAKQIFRVWYRLHENELDFPGTGMGLSICQKVIQRHRGKIWVESEGEGKGSTFYFTLPISRSQGLLFSRV